MLKLISHIASVPFVQKSLMALHRNPHILFYHMVRDERPDYYYQAPITRSDFRSQLSWLLDNGFEFVTLNELAHRNQRKKMVAITTDDGFAENYSVVAPILSEFGIKATFFLIGCCIDNKDLMWVNKLATIEQVIGREQLADQLNTSLSKRWVSKRNGNNRPLHSNIPMKFKEEIVNELWAQNDLPPIDEYLQAKKPYLTYQQIVELLAAGHSIGAHTMTHPRCSDLSPGELEQEVIGSVKFLERKFHTDVSYFAYPFGDRPRRDIETELLNSSGLEAFLGTKNSDLQLNGNRIWERDKMEQPSPNSQFWFAAVPILRKFLLRPLNVYK